MREDIERMVGDRVEDRRVIQGPLVLPDAVIPEGQIVLESGRIGAVRDRPQEVADLVWPDGWIIPGLVDLHIHGAAGRDAMDASVEAYRDLDEKLLEVGCTAYLPTTMSGLSEELWPVFDAFQAYLREYPNTGARGIHMEGPYIHPQRIGAQRSDAVRDAVLDEVRGYHERLGDLLKRITVAPERPGVKDLIAYAHEHDIRLSAGHSNATFEEAVRAFDAGVRQVTHLFNAMPALHHREPGLALAALLDARVRVEVIADGIHLHPQMLKMVARLKGPDGVLLVTDAIRAALLDDGIYDLGGQAVRVESGVARTEAGNLAGSTLTLLGAVLNFHRFAGVSLPFAVKAASLVPAVAMGFTEQGALIPGYWADVALVDGRGHNRMTFRKGQLVFDGR